MAISTIVVVSMLVILVVISGTSAYLIFRSPSVSPDTTTAVTSEFSTLNSTSSASFSQSYYPQHPCLTGYNNSGTLHVPENSNLTLCVRYFYYGSTIKVNSTEQLTMSANTTNIISPSSTLKSALSNFSVEASPQTFYIGGSSNENEGITIVYNINANPNSNGTYILNFGWFASPGSSEIQRCGVEICLVVGSGIPNYSGTGMTCLTMSQTKTGNDLYPSGTLIAEVVSY